MVDSDTSDNIDKLLSAALGKSWDFFFIQVGNRRNGLRAFYILEKAHCGEGVQQKLVEDIQSLPTTQVVVGEVTPYTVGEIRKTLFQRIMPLDVEADAGETKDESRMRKQLRNNPTIHTGAWLLEQIRNDKDVINRMDESQFAAVTQFVRGEGEAADHEELFKNALIEKRHSTMPVVSPLHSVFGFLLLRFGTRNNIDNTVNMLQVNWQDTVGLYACVVGTYVTALLADQGTTVPYLGDMVPLTLGSGAIVFSSRVDNVHPDAMNNGVLTRMLRDLLPGRLYARLKGKIGAMRRIWEHKKKILFLVAVICLIVYLGFGNFVFGSWLYTTVADFVPRLVNFVRSNITDVVPTVLMILVDLVSENEWFQKLTGRRVDVSYGDAHRLIQYVTGKEMSPERIVLHGVSVIANSVRVPRWIPLLNDLNVNTHYAKWLHAQAQLNLWCEQNGQWIPLLDWKFQMIHPELRQKKLVTYDNIPKRKLDLLHALLPESNFLTTVVSFLDDLPSKISFIIRNILCRSNACVNQTPMDSDDDLVDILLSEEVFTRAMGGSSGLGMPWVLAFAIVADTRAENRKDIPLRHLVQDENGTPFVEFWTTRAKTYIETCIHSRYKGISTSSADMCTGWETKTNYDQIEEKKNKNKEAILKCRNRRRPKPQQEGEINTQLNAIFKSDGSIDNRKFGIFKRAYGKWFTFTREDCNNLTSPHGGYTTSWANIRIL